MPAASLLVPPGLLAAAAVLTWALGLARVDIGRWPAAVGAWLALAALLVIWLRSGRGPLEFNLPWNVGAAPLSLRLGPVAVGFGLLVLLPAAQLLTFQERGWRESGVAALATCASLVASESASVLLTTLALGFCASLLLLALLQEQARATPGYWFALTAAGLLLVWAATVLEVTGGTSLYTAVPVTALRAPVFLLLAAGGVLCSGLLPARTWVSEVWQRPRLQAGTLAGGLLVPLGFLLLVRAYEMGAGQWPAWWLNPALAALGAATAAAAALRAQAAANRQGFLGEAVPLSGGLTLLGLALGTPFAVSAAFLSLAGSAVLAGALPLLPGTRRPVAVVALAVAAGAPPALLFGGRLLAVQAAIEAGGLAAFLGLAGAAAWLLGIAAAARAVTLPTAASGTGSLAGARLGVAMALTGGVALAALETGLALPLATEAMGSSVSVVSGGYLAVVTPSGGWPALTLAGPLLALGAIAALLSRARWTGWQRLSLPERGPGEPFLDLPLAGVSGRLAGMVAALRLPSQYRSLLSPAALEAAMASSRLWLWAAVTVALVVAVTR